MLPLPNNTRPGTAPAEPPLGRRTYVRYVAYRCGRATAPLATRRKGAAAPLATRRKGAATPSAHQRQGI
jgi:hypothetical protein